MFPGRISSIVLRASAVRLASAIKPTIRWPLSYQEKHVATVNRLNTKNVETKVAIKGAGEIDMELLYADEDRLSRSAHHCGPAKSRSFNRYRFIFRQLAAKREFQTGIVFWLSSRVARRHPYSQRTHAEPDRQAETHRA